MTDVFWAKRLVFTQYHSITIGDDYSIGSLHSFDK